MAPRAQPLRICYFGTYRANYTRNQILLAGLRANGATVFECHAQLWQGIEDRVEQASGGWLRPGFWRRVWQAYRLLIRSHRRIPDYDVMLIGYPGQFDAYLGRLLTWWRRRPMALDILMSLHLVAEERGLTARHRFSGRLLFWLEKIGLHLPDLLIAENESYEAYIRQKYGLPAERFRRVPHGADDNTFHPQAVQLDDAPFEVTYHGTFLPSHGLLNVIQAAQQLKDSRDIRFNFYGIGPEKARIEAYARRHRLENVQFHGFVSRERLLAGIARSHICLGVFGTTRQSNFTIQNKLWEGLAMRRAVISGDSATVRQVLQHREHIFLVSREDPRALAEGILELKQDEPLRARLAENGYLYYRRHNTPIAIGAATIAALRVLVARPVALPLD